MHRVFARLSRSVRQPALRSAAIIAAIAGAAPSAVLADDHPVMLQWFETRWSTIEYRMPDFFMAGYDSTWLPPPFKAADPTSAGFDAFDRFDLGKPGSETAYGTQDMMRAMIQEFHQNSALVYIDLVMNHNSGRNGSDDFHNAGGYPGFAMRIGTDFWGDFNDGTKQSFDPGASNYDLFNGDLVGLIDIAHQKNYQYVRQPISSTPGVGQVNIPPGTVRNRPDPRNRQFYPDRDNPAGLKTFTNPATGQTINIYNIDPTDANQTDPLLMKGDPVMENANAYLLRSTQWMMDVMQVDGFRLDAAKHIPQWFWNDLWDNCVFNRRKTFSGGFVTPFSFGEVVDSNSFTLTYTRKDGFGNRDALDLNGAGQLRDILNAGGFGSWQNVLNAHLDTADDGFNNGTRGVTHVFSHDNGSTGNGGSAPPLPGPERYALPQHCYLLFRPGIPIIYHNSREFIDRYQFRGFWPREGNPTALGLDPNLVRLVQASNGYARGEFNIRNSIINDAFVFERRRNNGPGLFESNVIVGVNDSFLNGSVTFNVYTSFPAGTRLHELTGTATDPVVDPNNQVPDVIVTQAFNAQNPSISGAQSWMTITVPYNRDVNGVTHHRGYVAYGPATPTGTLEVRKTDGSSFTSQFNADGANVPSYRRRLTTIPIVDTNQFELRLTTNKTDPNDPNWDDFACFRIDGGFPSAGAAPDFNGQNNGPDFSDSDPYIPRFESFVTQSSPLATTPGATNGIYRQTINTTSLAEGYHYIKVVAFRKRPSNTDPLFTEFRRVIYVDRTGPSVTLADNTLPIATPIYTARVLANDRTTNSVHILLNPPVGTDPLTLIGPSTQASQYDRFEYRRTFSGLRSGSNTFVVVAFEPSGRSSVTSYTMNVTVGSGDINRDGIVDLSDLYEMNRLLAIVPQPPPYDSAADLDANGTVNTLDLNILQSSLRPTELQNMSTPQR